MESGGCHVGDVENGLSKMLEVDGMSRMAY